MSIELTQEETKMIVDGSVVAQAIGRCEELVFGITDEANRELVTNTIGQVLEIVSHEFYLVPKLAVGEDQEPVEREAPADALDESLAALWTAVSN